MKLPLLLLPLLLVGGCARFSTTQQDITYDPTTGNVIRRITTRAGAGQFFDAQSQLAKFKATQTDKTQSAQVGDLGMQSTGTNAVQILDRLIQLANSLPH